MNLGRRDPFSLFVVALAGGVGGAKLADGLAQTLAPHLFTVVVNTGDDFEHFGLTICPDLDTVTYTLAGLANPETGWGRLDESWVALETVSSLGGPTWFRLGDRDLGLHLERTRLLAAGESLTEITLAICRALKVQATILPMSDQPLRTIVLSDEGELSFQDYFVARRCEPKVLGFRFAGLEQAQPAPGLLAALDAADVIVICPSNPWVSIDPILALPGVRPALRKNWVLAVSPLIAGETVKGPAAKMYAELGIQPSALAVARHYEGLLDGFILDEQDRELEKDLSVPGLQLLVTDTIMKNDVDRRRLAGQVLAFAVDLMKME